MEKILDWNKYVDKAAETVAEGIVMLKNDNNALPLEKGAEIAVFGRIQLHYYKSGTGSGGLVNVSEVIGITDGLIRNGNVKVNEELLDTYKKWEQENPFDMGIGWGKEPWSQKEMPVSEELAAKIAVSADTALVVMGRTAGEEQDNSNEKGSYLLSDGEEQMLDCVRRHFKKMVVLLNVGNIIDMKFVDKYSPDAVLYVWQGGMIGGIGTADVLTGKYSPSGKLPDTIAADISDYPSHEYFGNTERNYYSEDIYVGYRYFETFAKDKVRYPFGFGLSYTSFDLNLIGADVNADNCKFTVRVTNTGKFSGKEVVQLYVSAPQGKLGKPSRVLCGFEKTNTLAPGECDDITIECSGYDFSSYDDSGVSGHKSCYVLESGKYEFYIGTDVRSCQKAAEFELEKTKVTFTCTQALAPVLPFQRMRPSDSMQLAYEDVPLMDEYEDIRRKKYLPHEIDFTGDKNIKLRDVREGKASLDEFVAQLSDNDLSCIIRGEGMGSPKVTAGTASAFGGVSGKLESMGIPCACCSDGPSGMRLDCGTKAFSIPNGTLIASTFNKKLTAELFEFMGDEMSANKVDCLLGPGLNIHRYPLNGRNFEYFSEDPFLTGEIASAQLTGMHNSGVTGTVKHFCANNQETNRHNLDSVVSERALREIYLKGFEIAVRKGHAKTIMTSYGSVNGLWTSGSYDLNTVILRNEWGFDGVVMTDWWANINRRGMAPDKSDFAAMAMAQNDVYMVCANGAENNDNTLSELEKGTLTRAELQRNASNICRFIMTTHAMDRICECADTVKIINRPDEDENSDSDNVTFYNINGGEGEVIPTDICTDKGSNYIFAIDVEQLGRYKIIVTASTTVSELAQVPLTVFSMGTPEGTMTWNGTNGEPVSFSCQSYFFSRFTTIRLYFAQSGLKIHSIRFERTGW